MAGTEIDQATGSFSPRWQKRQVSLRGKNGLEVMFGHGVHDVCVGGFPRWRLWRRLLYSVEHTLGSLPVVVVAPVVAALLGTAWAVSHPSLSIRHGIVVGQATFSEALLSALIGGVIGLLALISLLWIGAWTWYLLLGGDRVWEAIYDEWRLDEGLIWRLRCRNGAVPANSALLGAVELWVRTPSGITFRSSRTDTWSYEDNRRYKETGKSETGLAARVALEKPLVAGKYQARWYVAKEGQKYRELARTHTVIGVNGELL